MLRFANRNIKLFFRDRASVFFSLLAVLITIMLYVLFLADIMVSDDMKGMTGIDALITSQLVAGLLTTASLTTTLGAIGIMIDDKAHKTEKDFKSSPISRRSLTGGYLLSTFVVGMIMTTLMFVLGEIFIVIRGGSLLAPLDMLKALGTIVLAVLTSTSIVVFMVSFFKSQNAFAAASTVVGTLIGFLTGVYIPIGVLPETVQNVVGVFPLSHAAMLFRQLLTTDALGTTFAGAPAQAISEFKEQMGTVLHIGSFEVTPLASVVVLAGTALVFYVFALINMSRKRQ